VSVERKSRYVIGGYLKDLKSETKAKHLIGRLGRFEVETITTDNGTENAKYEYMEEKLKTKVYFCHTYKRGRVLTQIVDRG
jgi:IS30 family transposase